MRYIVIIYLQQKKLKDASEAYKQLLAFVPKVTSMCVLNLFIHNPLRFRFLIIHNPLQYRE